MWLPVSLSRVSASEPSAMMVTSCTACTSLVRFSTSLSRNAFWSLRKSLAFFSSRCVFTRASTIGGLIGLVM
ncbi:hypothetical protein D3C83_130380 [compost metagenome]